MLERDFKQPVNVVNRTGGSGVVGHDAIARAPADGYTIGMITVEIAMMHWQKLTELNPTSYTPLALMNEDPPGVTVSASSPHQNIKALADAGIDLIEISGGTYEAPAMTGVKDKAVAAKQEPVKDSTRQREARRSAPSASAM